MESRYSLRPNVNGYYGNIKQNNGSSTINTNIQGSNQDNGCMMLTALSGRNFERSLNNFGSFSNSTTNIENIFDNVNKITNNKRKIKYIL